MKRLIPVLVGLLWACCATAQTTRPYPIAAFFQPARNVQTLAGLGVNTFAGPEIENAAALTPDQIAVARAAWIKSVTDAGGSIILKNPTAPIPANCVGFLMSVDEPNGKGIAPAALAADAAALRKLSPTIPIFLSLAGDKITSANFNKPAEAQLYRDYAALADVLTVDVYSMNRNASRYPVTWTGDAVAKLATVTNKAVWAWCECSDQKLLPAPKLPDIARGPTGDEIKATTAWAIAKGAKGIGWFATSSRGAYGWPQSYLPCTDDQFAAMRAVAAALNPSLEDRVKMLEARVAALEKK